MHLTIRPYEEAELAAILSLIKSAFKEHEGVVEPPPSAKTKTLDDLQTELRTATGLVATLEETLVGFVMFTPQQNALYLSRLAVLPGVRGRGVASQLVSEVEKEAKKAGFEALSLSVRIALTEQQAIYSHWGFQFEGYGTHAGASKATFIKLRKSLVTS